MLSVLHQSVLYCRRRRLAAGKWWSQDPAKVASRIRRTNYGKPTTAKLRAKTAVEYARFLKSLRGHVLALPRTFIIAKTSGITSYLVNFSSNPKTNPTPYPQVEASGCRARFRTSGQTRRTQRPNCCWYVNQEDSRNSSMRWARPL